MSEQPLFVPGARVAIRNPYDRGYTEAFVEKVYKNGRFTLRGSNQQWSPSRTTDGRAYETGTGWQKRSLLLWNAENDAEISGGVAQTRRINRLQAIQDRIRRINVEQVTDVMLDAIETALGPKP